MSYLVGKRFFSSNDGLQLNERFWTIQANAHASLALVHGVGDHGGRYTTLVSACQQHRLNLHVFDLRGHGESEGRRGHIDSWDQYRDDLSVFVDRIREEDSMPLFLMGHSLGALIVLEYVALAQPELSGLVISGVPLQPAGVAGPARVRLAHLLSRIWPSFQIPLGISPEHLSRDQAIISDFKKDPLTFGKASVRWGTESLGALVRFRHRMSEITAPILVVHGESDVLNLVGGAKELLDSVSSRHKELLIVPGGLHEPHNDTNGAQTAAQITEWITGRVG